MMIYWSYDGAQPLVAETGFGATVRRVGSVFLNFFSGTRWGRMFQQVR